MLRDASFPDSGCNFLQSVPTEKCFRNLFIWNWNQIVFAIFRLIWTTNERSPFVFQIQSENDKYNLISVSYNKISETFLNVYTVHCIRHFRFQFHIFFIFFSLLSSSLFRPQQHKHLLYIPLFSSIYTFSRTYKIDAMRRDIKKNVIHQAKFGPASEYIIYIYREK